MSAALVAGAAVVPAPEVLSTTMAKKRVLLDRNQVCRLCDFSESHLYRMLKMGIFPKPRHCHGHYVRWHLEDVEAWIHKGSARPGEPQPWQQFLDQLERANEGQEGGEK